MLGRGPLPATPSAPSRGSPRRHKRGDTGGSMHIYWHAGTGSPRCGTHHPGRRCPVSLHPLAHAQRHHYQVQGTLTAVWRLLRVRPACTLMMRRIHLVHRTDRWPPALRPARPARALRLGTGRYRAYYDDACPACGLPQSVDTPSSVEAPGPSPPCARPPRQPSSTPLRRDAAPPQDQSWTRNTSRQCTPAAPNGHQGRLRDAPHTYRSPQRSLTARCGVPPGTHATCQRGPRSEATLLPGLRTPGARAAVPGHGASREKRNAATEVLDQPLPCVQATLGTGPFRLPRAAGPARGALW